MRLQVGIAVAALLTGTPALATQINTGGETGSYHTTFCPLLSKLLKKNQFDFACTTSEGSRENIQRIVADPAQVGYTQFDVFALENERLGGEELFRPIRSDLGRECLFVITRNRDITNYGELVAWAPRLRWILSPVKSGSTGTFEFLQQVDPEGLGLANDISYARSTDEAIEQALADDESATLFVQFPDPANARFKLIDRLGGNIVPVIDRNILAQAVADQKVYYADETEISLPKWNRSASKVVTACTPMVIFTGTPERAEGLNARRDQEDLIRTIMSFRLEDMQPKQGFLSKLWRRTKALSGATVEELIGASDKAREAAKPMMESAAKRAKELADDTKAYWDKATGSEASGEVPAE